MIQKKLKGAALPAVIILCFLFSSLLLTDLLGIRLCTRIIDRISVEKELQDKVLMIQKSLLESNDDLGYRKLEGTDSIQVKRTRWGVLTLNLIRVSRGQIKKERAYFTSARPDSSFIELTSNKKSIKLCQEAELKGWSRNKFVSAEAGAFNTAQVNLETAVGIRNEKLSEPALPSRINARSLKLEMINAESNNGIPTIKNSFLCPPKVYYSDDTIELKNICLEGNIMIESASEILVDSSATLKHLILVGENIRFKEGFKGSVQAFSKNNLILEKRSSLNFPSVIGCQKETETRQRSIIIEQQAMLTGAIVLENYKPNSPSILFMAKGASFLGEVYVRGMLELQGTIVGSVYAEHFVTGTQAGTISMHQINKGKISGFKPGRGFSLLRPAYSNFISAELL